MKKKEINYKALFSMGVVFMGAGVVFLTNLNEIVGVGLLIIGALNMAIGAKNKDKWLKK